MGIILIPLFLLNFIFAIWVCVHIFMMKTLSPASWQTAMLIGSGISLLICLPTLFIKPSETGAQAAQNSGQKLFNILGGLITLPTVLVFILSFFPSTWVSFHFAEALLGAIAVCSVTLLTVFFVLPVIFVLETGGKK
jgi:hypothetical protein